MAAVPTREEGIRLDADYPRGETNSDRLGQCDVRRKSERHFELGPG